MQNFTFTFLQLLEVKIDLRHVTSRLEKVNNELTLQNLKIQIISGATPYQQLKVKVSSPYNRPHRPRGGAEV
jgi:hypothetical protein